MRCPRHGHILYLQIAGGLEAPTCVFSNQRVGWATTMGDNEEEGAEVGGGVDLVTIPAVEGRLVRFPGDAMHAVPHPAHRWFLAQEELAVLQEQEEADEEDDGGDDYMYDDDCDDDDDDDDDDTTERSVLLFNTWPITAETPPPRDVRADPILMDREGDSLCQLVEEWDSDFGKDAAWIRCRARFDWSSAPTRRRHASSSAPSSSNDAATIIGIPLMGESNRRLFPEKTARVQISSPKVLLAALTEERAATYFGPLGRTILSKEKE